MASKGQPLFFERHGNWRVGKEVWFLGQQIHHKVDEFKKDWALRFGGHTLHE